MKKQIKRIPEFTNTQAEEKFWATHDSTGYIDWDQAKIAKFPNLKLSTESILQKNIKWLEEYI
jgi:hypothetical protein